MKYFFQIIKWTIIGLTVRLLIMPFTMHGQDIIFLNYFPMIFIENGVWDPYGFIASNFQHFPATYYGPVLFGIMSVSNFILIKVFHLTSIVGFLEVAQPMMFKGFATVDYVKALANMDLFKNLFLLKTPYLIFDFLIGALLIKLSLTKEDGLSSYKIWMLNIVVLQSVYAVGGAYVIPAFFVIAALYAASRKRPFLAVMLLTAGGATQLFPYILVLPACFLLGQNWKERVLLIASSLAVNTAAYLPFYLSSGNSVLGFFMLSGRVQYPGLARWILLGLFIVSYVYILYRALKDSRTLRPERLLLYYLATVMFLSYSVFPIRFRYFVFITPLIALIMPRKKKYALFSVLIVLALAFQWLTQKDLQLGLFAPINAEYFLGLPAFQEFVGNFVDIGLAYKIVARALIVAFLGGAFWTWSIMTKDSSKPVIKLKS